jgi:hypothetical protein
MSSITHIHQTPVEVASVEMTPPHPPRIETPEYQKAHSFLINKQGRGCQVCGVTKRTLRSLKRNPFAAKQIETHHYPIERSLMDACDPVKVHKAFPQVYDQATLAAFVDSPANLIVLCDVHHRSVDYGIHHLLTQDWVIQPFLKDGYQIAATQAQAVDAMAHDQQLEAA